MPSDHQLAVPPKTPSCSPTVPHLPLVQLSHDSWPGPSRSLPHHPTSDLGRWGTRKFPEAPDSLGSPPLLPVDPVQLRLDCLNFSGGWVGTGEHDYLGPGSEHQLAAHWLCPGAECQCPWGRGQARADGSRARCGQHIFPGRPGCGLAVGVGSGPPAGPAAGLVRVEFEAICMGSGSSTQIPGPRLSCAVGRPGPRCPSGLSVDPRLADGAHGCSAPALCMPGTPQRSLPPIRPQQNLSGKGHLSVPPPGLRAKRGVGPSRPALGPGLGADRGSPETSC